MTKTIASYWQFLIAGLTKQSQTGAIVPSQRFLIQQMISPVPADYRGQVVELGAGTGVLTIRLARKCPRARVLACEINSDLAHTTARRLGETGLADRVKLVHESAERLLANLRRRGAPKTDFILSGIPLGTLDRTQALALVQSIHDTLQPGGMYIQFQYSLIDRAKVKATFSRLRTIPAFLNFPPAFIYYAQKARR